MNSHSSHENHGQPPLAGAAKPAMVRDPVCGMMIDPDTAAGNFDYQGQTYYFCNPGCLKKFQASPEVYLSKAPTSSGPHLAAIQPMAAAQPHAIPQIGPSASAPADQSFTSSAPTVYI